MALVSGASVALKYLQFADPQTNGNQTPTIYSNRDYHGEVMLLTEDSSGLKKTVDLAVPNDTTVSLASASVSLSNPTVAISNPTVAISNPSVTVALSNTSVALETVQYNADGSIGASGTEYLGRVILDGEVELLTEDSGGQKKTVDLAVPNKVAMETFQYNTDGSIATTTTTTEPAYLGRVLLDTAGATVSGDGTNGTSQSITHVHLSLIHI